MGEYYYFQTILDDCNVEPSLRTTASFKTFSWFSVNAGCTSESFKKLYIYIYIYIFMVNSHWYGTNKLMYNLVRHNEQLTTLL